MWFGLLGPFLVVDDRGSELDPGPPQRRELLALLLANANQVISVDSIIDALWPGDLPPRGAKASVQAHVSRLRQAIPERIITRDPGYLVRAAPDDLDTLDFIQVIGEARKLREHSEVALAFEQLSRAMALWRGEPFSDFIYTDWAQREIARLESARRGAQKTRFQLALELDLHHEIVTELQMESDANPGDEGLARLLAAAEYRQGRQAEALERIERVRRYLAEEMGLNTSPETEDLELAILQHSRSLRSRAEVDRSPVESIEDDTISDGLGNVVDIASAFIGRAVSIAELKEALTSHRLVTITGPGGAGKTRLAVRVAAESRGQFSDGTWMVELDKARNDQDVISGVRRSIGLVENDTAGDLISLTRQIGSKNILLVFDNCEHVADACARIIEGVIQSCPYLKVLTTSRVPLAIPSEMLWRVSPLDIPPLGVGTVEELLGYESALLFVVRAKDALGSFSVDPSHVNTVVRICRVLDGLPLAIEMAAAQVRYRSLSELATQVEESIGNLRSAYRSVPSRHRTMTAAVEWSIDALSEDERTFLVNLGVFDSTFDREMAAAVSNLDGEQADLHLVSLIDQNLVMFISRERSRYRLLAPIRSYLRQRALGGRIDAVNTRLASHIAEKAAASLEALEGKNAMRWYLWCADNDELLRDSLDWCVQSNSELGGKILEGLGWYLPASRDRVKWIDLMDLLLSRLSDASEWREVASHLSYLQLVTGDYSHAADLATAVLEDSGSVSRHAVLKARSALIGSRSLGDEVVESFGGLVNDIEELRPLSTTPYHRSWIEEQLGIVHAIRGQKTKSIRDLEKAASHFEDSLEVSRSNGFMWRLPISLNNHADSLRIIGRTSDAISELDEAVDLSRDLEMWANLAWVLLTKSQVALQVGDTESALEAAIEGSLVAHRHGAEYELAVLVELLALLLIERDKTLASTVHECAHWLSDRIDAPMDTAYVQYHDSIEEELGAIEFGSQHGGEPDSLLRVMEDLAVLHKTKSHI